MKGVLRSVKDEMAEKARAEAAKRDAQREEMARTMEVIDQDVANVLEGLEDEEQEEKGEERAENPFDHLGRPKFIDLPATLTPPGAKPSGLGHELSSEVPTVEEEEEEEDKDDEEEAPVKKPRTSLDKVKTQVKLNLNSIMFYYFFQSALRTPNCQEKD